ncbi:MAG: ATP-binding protein [Spirochaetales bacterium]|jgi:predicted ATP-dependent endonuclease of OLD family|nr:ATP-binding protein [Spirochaetales bacterium]
MKLVEVGLKNFRCYKEETWIPINDLTVFIGKNDVGKSAVFDALNIFLAEPKMIEQADASIGGDAQDVRIICSFSGFPNQLILDATNKTSLSKEYLLNKKGFLEIHKRYDCSLKTPKETVTAFAYHPSKPQYDDLLTLKNTQLKTRASQLGVDLANVNQSVNAEIRKAIWESCDNLELELREVELTGTGEDNKKIWDNLKNELPVFSLFKSDRASTDQDPEAQDPLKAAIDQAIKEQEEKLNEVSNYVKNEVEVLARKTIEKLKEMDPSLANELTPVFVPPNWKSVFKTSLIDNDQIPINKRGSGVRRLILLNFFRAKAEQSLSEKADVDIIYAIEEPETSQHPNNQKMLMKVFSDLANDTNKQVLLTTHTPTLIRDIPQKSIRFIEADEDKNRRVYVADDTVIPRIVNTLGVLPDHNIRLFIGVEGANDINFLCNISHVLHQTDPSIPDLVKCEDEGSVVFFPMGGNNLERWVSKMKGLNKPEFYLLDSDLKKPGVKSEHKKQVDRFADQPGCTALLTKKREMENYLHPQAIKSVWAECSNITFNDYDDVPLLVAQTIHEASESGKPWKDLDEKSVDKKTSSSKKRLNADAAKFMTLDLLNEKDSEGEVISWLRKIGELMDYDN